MMRTGVNMRTSEDAGPEKEGEEETTWGALRIGKRATIPEALASREVIATPADIFKEVRNADN